MPPQPSQSRTVLQLALIGGVIVVFLGALLSAAVVVVVVTRRGGVPVQPNAAPTPERIAPTIAAPPPIPLSAEPQMFGAKHLLVMYRGSTRSPATVDRTKEEARARAVEAQRKAKNGAAFADLVREYSDEPGAVKRGGDLGTFKKGTMVPEFQAAVEDLEVGQISEVVETPFGFHVIVRTK